MQSSQLNIAISTDRGNLISRFRLIDGGGRRSKLSYINSIKRIKALKSNCWLTKLILIRPKARTDSVSTYDQRKAMKKFASKCRNMKKISHCNFLRLLLNSIYMDNNQESFDSFCQSIAISLIIII
jgi:hypothetical protein